MNEDETFPQDNPFEDFLRNILGANAAEEAMRALNAQGFDPSMLPPEVQNPTALNAALKQMQFFMNTSTGPVDWRIVNDSARQQIYSAGDPAVSAAQAGRARQALSVADLWLDTVTDFAPGQVERAAWSRIEWTEVTLEQWKRICEPIALNVSRALTSVIENQMGGISGDPSLLPEDIASMASQIKSLTPKLATMMFSSQLGMALTALARETFGTNDVGIPLLTKPTTGLVVSNVEDFADGLDIPFEEVLQFVAVRECAHRRLFASVPWLEGDLMRAVENYATHIEIDMEALSDVARTLDLTNQQSIEEALSGGVFAMNISPEQKRSLERLETMLALIEGWVEVVTAQATAPYLPHADQLREMIRRRRATGGPAEQVLGQLIGLQMRPRRARGAASIFSLVAADGGREARDDLWSHPDMVPTQAELDSPDTFLTIRQAAREQDADIDAALNALLDGTMGWAEGLSPESDPESETLARAGFAPDARHDQAEDQFNDSADSSEDKDSDPSSGDTQA